MPSSRTFWTLSRSNLDEKTPLELEFLLRLRGEIEWPSPEALKAQIFKDVARAKRYLPAGEPFDTKQV